MATTILPLSKVINSSRFSLKSTAFDLGNFRSGNNPPNSTFNSDTPKGVLGGQCAVASADWEVDRGIQSSTPIMGLFSDQSEGAAFENAPAAASGVVAVYMCGGLFEVYIFETSTPDAAYASTLANYLIGAKLYCSPFGNLIPEAPTTFADHAGGVDFVVAYVTKVPTAADLRLGIKLIV